MSYSDKILTMSGKVSFTSLQQYLSVRGWRRQNTNKEDIVMMFAPNDNVNFDILLPLSRGFTDYSQSILNAVKKIAIYENREEPQILNDLILPPADILRYRVDNEQTSLGLISLKAGFELFESAKKSLLAAASDIVSPTLFHPRMAYKQAVQFIDACCMGQTEKGSFIASIVCPFIKITPDENPTQLTVFSSEETLQASFTRLVTRKLMYSVNYIKREIERGQIDSLIDPENKDAVSANFLESIVEMNEFTQNSKIEIAATWAPTIPLPTDIPSVVEITNDYIEPIKSVIDRIKPDVIETKGEYVGKISSIKADPDINNRRDGEITFVFISSEEKAISAKVVLEGENIHAAFRAFDEGKNVIISGNLKASSRQRIIEAPTFRIIE